MSEDHYSVLGVAQSASQPEIEKAYRALARKYHPDLHPDDQQAKQRFQQVQKAFEVLKDPEKRQMYDRHGSNFESMGGSGPFSGTGPGGFEFDLGDMFGKGGAGFEDILRGMGGQAGTTTSRPRRGRDINHELKVPFSTAVVGGEAQISVRRSDGRIEPIQIKIPAGIEDGKKMRLRGAGRSALGSKGGHGDILITVRVSPHPCFTRRGKNLEVRVPVTIAEAMLGAKVEVPTPGGPISLTVPPGTSSGGKLRVKGYGVQSAATPAGDLLAEIQIVVPEEADDQAETAMRHVDSLYRTNPRDKLKW